MNERPPISAADALKAVHALAPDAEATAEILALLGVERVAPPRLHAPASVQLPRIATDAPTVRERIIAPPPMPSTEERRAAALTRGVGRPTIATLEQQADDDGPPEWLEFIRPMSDAHERVPPRPEPIFATTRARSILAASVATRSADGPVEMRALIEVLCRLEPVRQLPRRPVATVRRGVQLIVDCTTSMHPFAQDVHDVLRVVEQVVGMPRTQLLRVTDASLSTLLTRERRAAPWRTPPRGTPVFIVTDFGIGGDPMERDAPTHANWYRLAKRARAAGCAVVALVPFAPRHWDAALTTVITHIHWDHRMTAGAVKRAIGPGHVSS